MKCYVCVAGLVSLGGRLLRLLRLLMRVSSAACRARRSWREALTGRNAQGPGLRLLRLRPAAHVHRCVRRPVQPEDQAYAFDITKKSMRASCRGLPSEVPNLVVEAKDNGNEVGGGS